MMAMGSAGKNGAPFSPAFFGTRLPTAVAFSGGRRAGQQSSAQA